jgi:hypothetical protein
VSRSRRPTRHSTPTPLAGFVGRKAFNVNGFNDLGLVGGVTLYVDAS